MKSYQWHTCRDEYIAEARAGRCEDWTRFDDEAGARALLQIRAATALPADECKAVTTAAINGLIEHCATGHADTCERNGTL